jgi:hypothetical protein
MDLGKRLGAKNLFREIGLAGLPGTIDEQHFLQHKYYTLAHKNQLKTAAWAG